MRSVPWVFSLHHFLPLAVRDSANGTFVTLDDYLPLAGYEPNAMEFTDTTELNDSISSDFIDFQDSLAHTVPSSDHYMDDDTLARCLGCLVILNWHITFHLAQGLLSLSSHPHAMHMCGCLWGCSTSPFTSTCTSPSFRPSSQCTSTTLTPWQTTCANGTFVTLDDYLPLTSVLKLKEHQRAAFFSTLENRCLPAST